jgi:ATP-binding cassette subfamily B protein
VNMAASAARGATIADCLWAADRLGDALSRLARHDGIGLGRAAAPQPPPDLGDQAAERVRVWIESAARTLGVEAWHRSVLHRDVPSFLRDAAPALIAVPGEEARFLVVTGRTGGRIQLLGPDGVTRALPVEQVRDELCREIEAPHVQIMNDVLREAELPVAGLERARARLVATRVSTLPVCSGWLLRMAPDRPLHAHLARLGIYRRLGMLTLAHVAQYVLWLLSWWLIGKAALEGSLDTGWLIGWALMLLTIVPVRALSSWSQGVLAVGLGGLLKQWLLCGALRLEPGEIRHLGSGQLLGRTIEADTMETLAIAGGFLGLFAVIELALAMAVLAVGAGGLISVAFLCGWLALTAVLAYGYARATDHWAELRLGLTGELVDRMVGYRTRLVQEPRHRWHEGEDQALEAYLDASAAMDARATLVLALVPRGWMVVGLASLVVPFALGDVSPASLAIALGGVLLAYEALGKLSGGLFNLVGAAIAWKQIAPLMQALRREGDRGVPSALAREPDREQVLLEAHNLGFTYPGQHAPVLRGCSLTIRAGDRILLEGPSGCGKSTLAAVLCGFKPAQSGLLLLRGLDRKTLGSDGWRRLVTSAPQFHENFVFTGMLNYNLLMGGNWPPSGPVAQEALELCEELGLGPVLARMPGGMEQLVGECGWQLSHGERSRLYIARALLQGADLVILDESFAALDPETLRQCMECVFRRAGTLFVIAHT